MQFWETKIASLVTPNKKFPRKDFIQLIDYHATLANQQSKKAADTSDQLLAEIRLLREDIGALAKAIAQREEGK